MIRLHENFHDIVTGKMERRMAMENIKIQQDMKVFISLLRWNDQQAGILMYFQMK